MKKAFFASFLCLGVIVASVIAINFGRKNNTVQGLTNKEDMQIKCKSAYLMDYDSGTVIYKSNENDRHKIASMTKIMTLILAFEDIDSGKISLDDKIVVSKRAASMGGSQAFLEEKCEYSMGELIKTIVIASANDSSVAIAERLNGSVENFVSRMNKRAQELNLKNTLFENCTGLPSPSQYSCAKDVSEMTMQLLSHKQYYNYTKIWLEDFTHPTGRKTTLTNTNKLIRFYDGCDSGKTGFTNEAGHCISASAKRGDMRLIATVIGSESSKDRFALATNMFNHGFANYESKCLIEKNMPLELDVKVSGGKKQTIKVALKDNITSFSKKGDKGGEADIRYEFLQSIKAPVKKGDVIGKCFIMQGENIKKQIDIVAYEDLDKITFKDILNNVIDKWSLKFS